METANVPANELACPVCLEIPSRVLECSQCRQVLCAACETHLPRCPLCRAEPLQARPCPPVQRLLDRLRARCPFCDREVARTELDAHMHWCEQVPQERRLVEARPPHKCHAAGCQFETIDGVKGLMHLLRVHGVAIWEHFEAVTEASTSVNEIERHTRLEKLQKEIDGIVQDYETMRKLLQNKRNEIQNLIKYDRQDFVQTKTFQLSVFLIKLQQFKEFMRFSIHAVGWIKWFCILVAVLIFVPAMSGAVMCATAALRVSCCLQPLHAPAYSLPIALHCLDLCFAVLGVVTTLLRRVQLQFLFIVIVCLHVATLILHLPSAFMVSISKFPATLLDALSNISSSTTDDDTGNEWSGEDDKADITPYSPTASLSGPTSTHVVTLSFFATFLEALSYISPSTADDEWTTEREEPFVRGPESNPECASLSGPQRKHARLSRWLLLVCLASPTRNLLWHLLASFEVTTSTQAFCW